MITVSVRLFAAFREQAGWSDKEMDLPGGVKLHELMSILEREDGLTLTDRSVYAAVNQEYEDAERELIDGDVIALFPPVSGG